ncbi:MAG: gliding motility-associated ABC transporter substrate-binding protein GldG [Cyclobacteriaceae bacterium]|nr:gliding motility-associated ABC transporter substrate-binding protein GldG [Cyclobacteriaceae bacterium]UYN86143.1 MAG: gliding motility-associated ABC transporter substrate-binding protein GldG [Cyclobacteriaceae bacterium]
MVNLKGKKTGDLLLLANGLVLIILLNLVSADRFFRIDLTEEKRFSIKPQTKALLNSLVDDIYIEVYLEGDLNASFRRLKNSIREVLDEFRIYSGNRVKVTFVDPSAAMSQQARNEFMEALARKGVTPTRLVDRKDGQTSEKLIFPGAVLSYGGMETGVTLLKGNKARRPEEEINQSIEGLEYELANVIYKLTNTDRKRIGFLQGHGELDSLAVASLNNALLDVYDVYKVNLQRKPVLKDYDALIVAKPTRPFSEQDKYKLDQYIMSGGRVLFLLDRLEATMDSASREDYFAFPYELRLDDLLFKYGVRINADLIQDRTAGMYPVITGEQGGKPQLQLMDWPFFPLINRYADHPIALNLDAIMVKFVSTIDTVKADGIIKTPLAFTSAFSRKVTAPVPVSINEIRRNIKPESFSSGNLPVAYLLEGKFTSVFKNRFLPEGAEQSGFKAEGSPSKIIVVSDGDIARNDINPRTGNPQQLGLDPFTNYTFANEEFLLNAIAWLVDENGLIKARSKEVKIRPLNKEKIRTEKTKWQVINLVLPIVVLMVYGMLLMYLRKRKFAAR